MIKKCLAGALAAISVCSVFSVHAQQDFPDLAESHWAYGAVQELVEQHTVNGYEDGTFRPNGIVTYAEFEKMITGVWNPDTRSIDRESALDMLWRYSGEPSGGACPGVITSQMTNGNAAAWGYNTGLMIGDDGLNLRSQDSLTRAEAATLIVRANRGLIASDRFADTVSPDILKMVYDSYALFDTPYVPEEKITSQTLVDAASRLSGVQESFSKDSPSVYDAAVVFANASGKQSGATFSAKDMTSVPEEYGLISRVYMAYALEKGMVLPTDSEREATKKDVALILLQLDKLYGRYHTHLNLSRIYYPDNYADYAFLSNEVALGAYAVPFESGRPADSFAFGWRFSYVFETLALELGEKYEDQATFTYYPTLYAETASESVCRMKVEMKDGVSAETVFGDGYASAGRVFYVDVHTNHPVIDVYVAPDQVSISGPVYVAE